MNNTMKHRGYVGSIEVNHNDGIFHGKIIHINAVVSYEGTTYNQLKQSFIDAVDDYLEFCEEKGMNPEKSCSGSFNVRTGTERHKKAIMIKKHDESLNEFVNTAIDHEIKNRLSSRQ